MTTRVPPLPAERFVLNIGPSHPVTHGTLRIQIEAEGETIVRSACEIGYLHRGFEKESERVFWEQVTPYAERLNYCSSLHNSVAWCHAVETLLGIGAPIRAQALRVIASEVARIMDHLVCLAANILDIGALSCWWYLYNVRERLYDLVEDLCGHRLMITWGRVGGVATDLPEGWGERLLIVLETMHAAVGEVRDLVGGNRIFLDRVEGICVISVEDAVSHGFTGPCLRACGVASDLRKDEPYWGYDQYAFDVPVRTHGDTLDRMWIRFDEIEQSARIVRQVLADLPSGPVLLDHPGITLPAKEEVHETMEGLIRHFKRIMHGIRPPAGVVYSATEAPNGELGFTLVSDGGPQPWRVKVRSPSFAHFSAFPRMINGSMIADAVAALGSLNVIAGELDR